MTYAEEKALVYAAILHEFEQYVGIGNGCNDISHREIEESALIAADAVLAALDEARLAEQAEHPPVVVETLPTCTIMYPPRLPQAQRVG